MNLRQGDVYLVEFGKKFNSEFGKRRPAVVVQTDRVNILLEQLEYKSVAVVPLSTQRLSDAFFRVDIAAREELEKDSQAVCNWICTVDAERIRIVEGRLCRLSDEEMRAIKSKLAFLME